MRLIVSAGASGGGINPALAALQALNSDAEVLWLGSAKGLDNDLIARAGIPFKGIPGAAVHGVGFKAVSGLFQLSRGYFAARRIIQDFKPDVMFFTGGYTAIPTGLAGRKVPTVIFLPDVEPGLAIKTIARFADVVAVPSPDSVQYFPPNKRIEITGYPTRATLGQWDKASAYAAFGFSPDKPTLLVTGGSQGARSINQAVVKNLPALLPDIQIVHTTGQLTWPEVETAAQALPPELAAHYHPAPYLHEEMGAAYAIADLIVSRAGASVLGEYPLFGIPAILVPYPHAWRYQKVNADHLANRGAALVLKDEDLEGDLLATIQELMHNKTKLAQMQAAMRQMAQPNAAGAIASLLRELAQPAAVS